MSGSKPPVSLLLLRHVFASCRAVSATQADHHPVRARIARFLLNLVPTLRRIHRSPATQSAPGLDAIERDVAPMAGFFRTLDDEIAGLLISSCRLRPDS